VHSYRVLIIRAVLGILFSLILWRLFYPQAPLAFVAGLCLVLVGLSYLVEYLRQRKKDPNSP
jgi:uncharacterized membrane protein HdeD (DUF308 family)